MVQSTMCAQLLLTLIRVKKTQSISLSGSNLTDRLIPNNIYRFCNLAKLCILLPKNPNKNPVRLKGRAPINCSFVLLCHFLPEFFTDNWSIKMRFLHLLKLNSPSLYVGLEWDRTASISHDVIPHLMQLIPMWQEVNWWNPIKTEFKKA